MKGINGFAIQRKTTKSIAVFVHVREPGSGPRSRATTTKATMLQAIHHTDKTIPPRAATQRQITGQATS